MGRRASLVTVASPTHGRVGTGGLRNLSPGPAEDSSCDLSSRFLSSFVRHHLSRHPVSSPSTFPSWGFVFGRVIRVAWVLPRSSDVFVFPGAGVGGSGTDGGRTRRPSDFRAERRSPVGLLPQHARGSGRDRRGPPRRSWGPTFISRTSTKILPTPGPHT